MILYLSRNETANLLDQATSENNLHIRKISGSFSLSEFITIEMRKYASCRYFCVDRLAITESDNEFLEALQSFQMMFNARVIVLHGSVNGTGNLMRGLLRIGITNIVTASELDDKLAQISECLSTNGMQNYAPKQPKQQEHSDYGDNSDNYNNESYERFTEYEEKKTLAQIVVQKEIGHEHYRFDCLNVKIGIIGATRRVGTTTIAISLANFIKNHGGTVCYVALNTNGHLESIANAYNFDAEEDYYTYDAIDFYEGILPKYDYNFVIMDFGDVKRETARMYKESDVHLLCGAGDKLHEVIEFSEGLKSVKSVKPLTLSYAPNPEYIQIFESTVTNKPTLIKPAKNMLDFKTNGLVFKGIIQPYIVETLKRL